MADYPGSLPSFTNPSPGDPANDASATDATVVVAKIHGELAAALAELGVNPSGGSATVVARLDALDSTVSGKADSSSLAETIRDTMGTALVAGSNVTITVNDAGDTITIAASGGGGGLTEEEVEDVVSGLLVAGSNISLTYDDVANTLTVAVSGLGDAAAKNTGTSAGTVAAGDHNHSGVYAASSHGHTAADVSDFAEVARDTLGTALTAGTGVTITPNDGADTITVATSAILPTLVDAKGDLLVATAADTVGRLAVGTNGHVLTADSAEASGVKWAAASGGSSYVDPVLSTWAFQTSTSVASDPGSGKLRANSATFASITELALSDTDSGSTARGTSLDFAKPGDTLVIRSVSTPANFARFRVGSPVTDWGTYRSVTVTPVGSNGFPFANEHSVSIALFPATPSQLPLVFVVPGTLTTGAKATKIFNDTAYTWTVKSLRAAVGTAPTGAAIKVDARIDGVGMTLSANRTTINVSATESTKNTSLLGDQVVQPGSVVDINVTQIGSGTAGADLTFVVNVEA